MRIHKQINLTYHFKFVPLDDSVKIYGVIDTIVRARTPGDWWLPKPYIPNGDRDDSPYRGSHVPSPKMEQLMEQYHFRVCTAFTVRPEYAWYADSGEVYLDFETVQDQVAFKLAMSA